MKNYRLFFSTFLAFILLAYPVLAQEATNSSFSNDEVTEKIKEKLKEVEGKNLEKVKGAMEEKTKAKIYAWFGPVASASAEKLTIKTSSGLREAKVASSAAIFKVSVGKSNKTLKVKNIQKDQFAIVMGPKKEKEIILAKRIIILDETPTTIKRQVISGKIKEIDEAKVTIQQDKELTTLIISKKTKLKIKGIKKPTIEDIQVGDFLNAIVVMNKKDEISSTAAVLVIPGTTNPQAKENEIKSEKDEKNLSSTPSAKEN